MKKMIKKIKDKLVSLKSINSNSPYKERLYAFQEEYKALSKKYDIDFTMLPIDLKKVYTEDGVNKIKTEDVQA